MEALWNLEDKWKLSTRKAVVLFACTSFLVIGICLVVMLKRRELKRRGSVHQVPCSRVIPNETATWANPSSVYMGRRSVMRVLIRSVRWSGASKWDEGLRGSQRESPTPLLVKGDLGGPEVGWQSHNSASAVWQKPILMGEKCELPRFSGLILYDQRGMPLHQCEEEPIHKQEKSPPVVRTTLRDLL